MYISFSDAIDLQKIDAQFFLFITIGFWYVYCLKTKYQMVTQTKRQNYYFQRFVQINKFMVHGRSLRLDKLTIAKAQLLPFEEDVTQFAIASIESVMKMDNRLH